MTYVGLEGPDHDVTLIVEPRRMIAGQHLAWAMLLALSHRGLSDTPRLGEIFKAGAVVLQRRAAGHVVEVLQCGEGDGLKSIPVLHMLFGDLRMIWLTLNVLIDLEL